MANRVVLLRTKQGGTITISVNDDYNFPATMKAMRSDGMLLSDTCMVPWDSIDSVLLTTADMVTSSSEGKAN